MLTTGMPIALRALFATAAAASAIAIAGCATKSKPRPEPEPDASEVAADAPAPSASAETVEAPASASAVASAITAPSSNPDPHLAREAALRDAQALGMIGLLNKGAGGDPDAPTAPWGRDDSVGTDPLSARGNMWGDSIGDSFGQGGLGLTGIGEGGGGRGEGIGLGSVGSLGHGAGTGQGIGSGGGAGRLAKPRGSVAISSRVVSGSLPPEVVTRILRARVAMLQACYEAGLKTDPTLAGDVALEFTIDTKGAAGDVRNPGEASAVGLCMTKALAGASFPAPEGGPCSVSASVKLTPPKKSAKIDEPATGDSIPKIHGKALAEAQASDVAEAMRTAGCTDVVIGSKNDAIVITAKYRDADLTVTFAPAGGRPVAAEEAKRLRGAAVLVEADGMFLAIEGPRTIAESLRRAIVVASAG